MREHDLLSIWRVVLKPGGISGWWQIRDLKEVAAVRFDRVELKSATQICDESNPAILTCKRSAGRSAGKEQEVITTAMV
jgi:hypothetical protein